MNTSKHSQNVWLVSALLCMGVGFVLQWWPLGLIAICIAAFTGHGGVAVGLGFVLDIVYGAPPGLLHYTFFPFVLSALVAWLLHMFMRRHFFDSSRQERL